MRRFGLVSAFADWPDDEAFDLAAVYQRLLTKADVAGYEVGSASTKSVRRWASRKRAPILLRKGLLFDELRKTAP